MLDYIPLTAAAGKKKISAGPTEHGHPVRERRLANRRFGFTVRRDDALRSAPWSRRLPTAAGDEEWLALVESIAFARAALAQPDLTFSDGAGI